MRDQQNEPLNDDLAREIEQALAVEPSPEFQARVRQRVAQAAEPRWIERWRWAAAFAAVVGAVTGTWLLTGNMSETPGQSMAVVSSGPRDRDGSLPAMDSTASKPRDQHPGGATPPVVPLVRAEDDRSTRVHVSVEPPIRAVNIVPSPRDPFSDVLVSASEVRAVRQVAALLSPEDVLKAPPPSSRPEEINELVIAPIAVAPIQLRPIEGEAE